MLQGVLKEDSTMCRHDPQARSVCVREDSSEGCLSIHLINTSKGCRACCPHAALFRLPTALHFFHPDLDIGRLAGRGTKLFLAGWGAYFFAYMIDRAWAHGFGDRVWQG